MYVATVKWGRGFPGGLQCHLKSRRPRLAACVVMVTLVLACIPPAAGTPRVILPDSGLSPLSLAIIVNDDDPLSARIAAYYQENRRIPPENMIHIRIDARHDSLRPREFVPVYEYVRRNSPPHIKAYALTWIKPYRVGCMSITTAFAAGFDREWCSRERCAPTRRNPAFGNAARDRHHGPDIRPTMSIAAASLVEARKLIDRGIRADGSNPPGTAYLVSTSDKARNVRAYNFAQIKRRFTDILKTEIVKTDQLRDRDDILFYFTGLKRVAGLETLGFRPGAIADHLTSAGGKLTRSGQMSSLNWLEAGATGSYGTVVEPCNLRGKFPNPMLVMDNYLWGDTLLEAYWKSVAMPGEGIFIGAPLAAPFDKYRIHPQAQGYLLETRALPPGAYILDTARSPVGPYRREPFTLAVRSGQTRFRLPKIDRSVYRLSAARQAQNR